MAEIISRRNEIVEEAVRRLSQVYTSSGITHGIPHGTVSTYNQFFLFDLPDTMSLASRNRGMYESAFPLSISYWFQADPKEIMKIGNVHMDKIRLSMELDERFATPDTGKGLCIRYYLDERALIWYDEGVMDVELMYVFEYVLDAGWVTPLPFASPTLQGG